MVADGSKISFNRQLSLLNFSKGSFYYVARPESEKNLVLMRLMDEHHLDHPTKRVLQMQDHLSGSGYHLKCKGNSRLEPVKGKMNGLPQAQHRPPLTKPIRLVDRHLRDEKQKENSIKNSGQVV
jgi:hypothetical protein